VSEPEKSPETPVRAPAPLLWASRLAYLEGLLAIGFGIADALHTSSDRVELGLTAALFFVAYGAALCWCAWGMAHLRHWSRGPLLFSQLVLLGLAVNFAQADRWPFTVVLAVLAAGTLAGMLAPSSVVALEEGGRPVDHKDD
jgi:hypothetical protein